MKQIQEWENVTLERFRDQIRPLAQPAVMRGVALNWPLVQHSLQAPASAVDYLSRFSTNAPVSALIAPPSANGRLFYNESLSASNFGRTSLELRFVLNQLLQLQSEPSPPGVAIQAAAARDFLPGLEADNPMPLAPGVDARLWIGNSITVAPHYDAFENIACVAAGRRRFTVFPPEQLPNLYVGPLENTPGGAPISMVDLNAPDFHAYPRFKEALSQAQAAELGPGDLIYLPYMWWHGVQSLEPFNVLVNYWWNDQPDGEIHPRTALTVARLAFKDMTQEQRQRWQAFFDHYIFFPPQDLMDHLPQHARGVFGNLQQHQYAQLRNAIARAIEDPN